MSEDTLLDVETIATLRAMQTDGSGDIIRELTTTLRAIAPALLEKIRTAAAQSDSEALYKAAHSLKGNSAALGAVALAACAKELEMMGRMRNLQNVAPLLTQLEQLYTRTLAALDEQSPA